MQSIYEERRSEGSLVIADRNGDCLWGIQICILQCQRNVRDIIDRFGGIRPFGVSRD